MNGYRVIVLEGGPNGKGLINWNFLGGVKMAVNFNNISVYEVADNPNAGCVYAGEMVVEGSDNSVLDADVQSRLNSLYAKINDPNSYAGSFAEALAETQRQAQALIEKIAAGETPTAAELRKFKSVCKAVETGVNGWKTDIEGVFSESPAIANAINTKLDKYKSELQKALNCIGSTPNGGGGNHVITSQIHLLICDFSGIGPACDSIKNIQETTEVGIALMKPAPPNKDISSLINKLPAELISNAYNFTQCENCQNSKIFEGTTIHYITCSYGDGQRFYYVCPQTGTSFGYWVVFYKGQYIWIERKNGELYRFCSEDMVENGYCNYEPIVVEYGQTMGDQVVDALAYGFAGSLAVGAGAALIVEVEIGATVEFTKDYAIGELITKVSEFLATKTGWVSVETATLVGGFIDTFRGKGILKAIKDPEQLKKVIGGIIDNFKTVTSKVKDADSYMRAFSQKARQMWGTTVESAQEAWSLIKRKIWRVAFKVGDNIAGVTIKQVRKGSNDKIIIIGRQMREHVYKVADALKSEGKYVEVLDDDYLKPLYDDGFEFVIDGKKWTVNSAWDDMVNNPNWLPYKDSNGFIKIEYLDKTPMYKLNQKWIEKAKNDGATIIDIGYPDGHDMSISGFYEMEKLTINWD